MKWIPFLFCFLRFFPIWSQPDTIFKKDDQKISCRITAVNSNAIFYLDKEELGRFVELSKVKSYIRNGVRKDPAHRIELGMSAKVIDTVNVSDELVYMRTCLTRFHTQYTTGMSLSLIGGALTASSFLLEDNQSVQQVLGISGAVILLVGIATSFDAHKWVARAGWGIGGKGNMVEVRYRFK
ncbi:MAG: hypothetical protein PSX36_09555 [bacterium]|nr:hypothetical protein [bacterium]